MFYQLLFGFALSTIIAFLAWKGRSLSQSGAIAAFLVGGLIFGLGGLRWAVLLLVFFMSSSALSHAFRPKKTGLSEKFSKGSQRDWSQVAANGGFGAAIAVLYAFQPGTEWLWVAFAGAMAAVNADTWGTELGVLSKVPPMLVTTGKTVERGTSGGISLLGSIASLGGALLLALAGVWFNPAAPVYESRGLLLFGAILFGGAAGAFFDSFLGATVQAIYYCPQCQKETERHPTHLCGTPTMPIRGWTWMNNEVVNFICSLVGATAASSVWLLLA